MPVTESSLLIVTLVTLPCSTTCRKRLYGRSIVVDCALKKLKKSGRADLLIAAITLANRATLVTRNEKDFRQVPGLQVENWVD